MIGQTDLLHPSPAPHFKTFHVYFVHVLFFYPIRDTDADKIAKIITLRFNINSDRSTRYVGGARAMKTELNFVKDKRGDKITRTAGVS